MSTLSERLDTALKRLPEATQADLAAFCGVSGPSVSNWFTGETKSLKASSLRKASEFLGCDRDWLETGLGLPGWKDSVYTSLQAITAPPLSEWVAREASLSQYTVSPLKTAEEIMQGNIARDEFRFALPDDAMAPEHPAGLHIIFSQSRTPRHGLIVLVQTRHGELHVRQHAQGREPGHWLAVPRQAVYASFDCHDDGLIIRGVMRGTYDPRD